MYCNQTNDQTASDARGMPLVATRRFSLAPSLEDKAQQLTHCWLRDIVTKL
jgi:hypothetical protein